MSNPEPKPVVPEQEESDAKFRGKQFRQSIYSVPVTATVSLGKKRISVSEVLELKPNSIVALETKIEDPVELIVDGRVIARGDLIETGNGTLGLKITEITERSDGEYD